MRTKGSVLIVLVLSLGAALAMAVPGRVESAATGMASATKEKAPIANRSAADSHQTERSDIPLGLSAIKRTAPKNIKSSGLFQPKSWYVPPPPPPVSLLPPPPPPPPTAPQLPFTFIGRMIDGNDVTLFLSNNNRQYTAKLNDILDNTYRVDRITEKSAVLTYLPMNIQQELVYNSTAIGISALSASVSDTAIQPTNQTQQQIENPR